MAMNLYGYEILREDDLMHHGIKGQKWGVRRYQNEDGSLTAEGQKRAKFIKTVNRNGKAYDKNKALLPDSKFEKKYGVDKTTADRIMQEEKDLYNELSRAVYSNEQTMNLGKKYAENMLARDYAKKTLWKLHESTGESMETLEKAYKDYQYEDFMKTRVDDIYDTVLRRSIGE